VRELGESVWFDKGLLRYWAWAPVRVEGRCENFSGLDRAFASLYRLGVEGCLALRKADDGFDVFFISKGCGFSVDKAVDVARTGCRVFDASLSAGCLNGFRLCYDVDFDVSKLGDVAYRVEPVDELGFRDFDLVRAVEGRRSFDYWVVVAFKPVKADGLLMRLKRFAVKRMIREELYACRADVRDGRFTRSVVDVDAEYRVGRLRELYDVLMRGVGEGLWRASLYVACNSHRSVVESALYACAPCSLKVREVDVEDVLRGLVRRWFLLTSSQLAKLVEPIFKCVPSTLVEAEKCSLPSASASKRDGAGVGLALSSSERPMCAFALPVRNLMKHVVIFGSAGSGKSTTIRVLVYGLSKVLVPSLVLDWTGEHAEVLSKCMGSFKVFSPGLNLRLALLPESDSDQAVCEWVDQLDYCVQAVWRAPLTPLQQRVLFEEARRLVADGKRGADDLLEALERRRVSEARRDWLQSVEALISRLRPLAVSPLREAFSDDLVDLDYLTGCYGTMVNIVDLSVLPSTQAKAVFAHLLLKKLYDYAVKQPKAVYPKLVVVVDEAHNLAPAYVMHQGVLERIAEELRKYGVGLIVATLRPSMLSRNIIGSASTIICHRLSWSDDIEVVAKLPGFEQYAKVLNVLPPGYAIISTPGLAHRGPVYVKIGLPEHEKLVGAGEVAGGNGLPGWARKALEALVNNGGSLRRREDLRLSRRQAELLRDLGYVELDGDLVSITDRGRLAVESS